MSLVIQFIQAGIYYDNIQPTYNLGDRIDVEVNVDLIKEGHLIKTDLICTGTNVISFNLLPSEEGIVEIKLPLNFHTINEANGECHLYTEYDQESQESRKFKISNALEVYLDTESFYANPGETLTISGNAKKINGAPANGNVEVTIPLLTILETITEEPEIQEENNQTNQTEETTNSITPDIEAGKFYGKVDEGFFSVDIQIPYESPAGEYRIDALVYEQVSGTRASEGIAMANLEIFQILTEADIALNNQNINPGEELQFKPILLDQTGNLIPDEISVIIRNSQSERIFEKIVQSDETVFFKIPFNQTSGYYEIEASSKDVNNIKKFYINEKEIASFELINNSLIVKNIGNIPYQKDIQIELNGKPFVKKVELELGNSKEFKLTGSGEEYNIRISDGENELNQGGVVLTGNAVSVRDIKETGSMALKTPIVWIFFILILGAGTLFLFRNIFKKKSFAYPFFKKKKNKTSVKTKETLKAPNQAEQGLVAKGDKNKAVAIVLKIKNKINDNSKKSLEKAVECVYKNKGAIYEQGDYLYMIFSPVMTKSNKNEGVAAKCAEKIALFLKEHNKKFNDKFEFGIGINSGDIVSKIENKKLKFTALGNFISTAKRLADASDKQILVTKESYKKGISEIKADKKEIGEGEVYEIKKVIDYEKNKEFIRNFLERQKKEQSAEK